MGGGGLIRADSVQPVGLGQDARQWTQARVAADGG